MSMKTKLFFTLFSLTLIFASCIKEDDSLQEMETPTPELYMLYSGQDISANFFVKITDPSSLPLSGAVVWVDNVQSISDEHGIAQFSGVSVDSKRTHVKVSASGYLDGSRNINPTDNGLNYVNIQMMQKVLLGTFNTAAGSSLDMGNGVLLDFAAGALKNDNGGDFNGEVSVYSAYIDPSSDSFGWQIPGDLIGMDGTDANVLESYGMIGVELESPTGEELNLGDGQEATLTFPVPSAMQSSAPSSIPLWNYNTTNNVWEKEGDATLQGETYVGNVSHFSWWNCDYPGQFVEIEFSLEHGEAALPLGNANFGLCLNGFTATGTTNSNGLFEGLVPMNETLTLKVYDPCGNVIHTQTVGPFAVDTDLGIISLPAVDVGFPLTGTAVDCNGDPVTSGYAVMHELGSSNEVTTIVNADGTFTFPVVCSSVAVDFNLFIVDTGNGFSSEVSTISYDPTSLNDVGEIDVCNAVLSEYFTAIYDGTTYDAFSFIAMTITPSCIHVNAEGAGVPGAGLYTYFSIENNGGVGPAIECTPDSTGGFSLSNGGSQIFVNYSSISADVTTYPTMLGDYLIGTYSADYDASGPIPAGTITGTFSVLND